MLKPYLDGTSELSLTGKITLVAMIWLFSINIAPSCSGLFLKKIVSRTSVNLI